ncbi:MAG: Sua5/YciO/YrdC/YwlC family protein [Thiohalobacterales bacterium]|nr:Sua5/YciO/YrdC/YwlC family protein [Thiohalobacterales bacterium]
MNWHIREAVRHIASGGVIAYPTDTVYGLGCDPLDAAAVLHLLALKHRSMDNGVILIGSDLGQFNPFLLPMDASTKRRISHGGKTPVTWVLPCRPETPVWLRGRHDSLAIRVTRHPVVTALCEHWGGPLVSTSANIHGHNPATGPLGVRKAFNGKLDYILHGSGDATNRPSTLRDGLTGEVLRA